MAGSAPSPRCASPSGCPALPLPADLPAAPLLPVLDGIGNPHNLGAIARSAAFFGCRSLLLTDDPRQADLSDAAFRTAEGGLEVLRVLRARDLPNLLRGMRGQYLVVAAVAAGGVAPAALPRGRPVALVLGNEEQGPVPAAAGRLRGAGDPAGGGLVESLNVSAAAAVLFHALAGPPVPRPGPAPGRAGAAAAGPPRRPVAAAARVSMDRPALPPPPKGSAPGSPSAARWTPMPPPGCGRRRRVAPGGAGRAHPRSGRRHRPRYRGRGAAVAAGGPGR